MTFKIGGCVFFHLPIGNTTGAAHSPKPFVSEPACRPAVSGVFNHKGFVAVSCNPGLISDSVNRLNSMQQPFARRPEFNFFNESKEFNPFAIEAFSGLFNWFLLCHDIKNLRTRARLRFLGPRLNVSEVQRSRLNKNHTAFIKEIVPSSVYNPFHSTGYAGYAKL